jgi:hypothetical protein
MRLTTIRKPAAIGKAHPFGKGYLHFAMGIVDNFSYSVSEKVPWINETKMAKRSLVVVVAIVTSLRRRSVRPPTTTMRPQRRPAAGPIITLLRELSS